MYSYAATETVVGAQHSKPGGETKTAEIVSVHPEKPKSGSKKQPPPADVPHKQGPLGGDLYAMPDKKVPEVGHKAGPQGDMYAMAAKPSKVSGIIIVQYSLYHTERIKIKPFIAIQLIA